MSILSDSDSLSVVSRWVGAATSWACSDARVTACFIVVVLYALTYFDGSHRRGGRDWPWFKTLPVWRRLLATYFSAKINVETPLTGDGAASLHIFGCFPHGATSVSHFLTMTDACGMLTKVFPRPRRDLAASVLFHIPIVRDLLLFLGNVDASSATAQYNLKRGRSLLIFVGGEKEQLMTQPRQNKVYLAERKGFVKLAIEHGASLVPMYVYGENECYHVSQLFIGLRVWLQEHFKIGLPIVWGVYGTPIPLRVPITVEIGAPIKVTKKERQAITNEDVDALHATFVKELTRLFDRTKTSHGYSESDKLMIC